MAIPYLDYVDQISKSNQKFRLLYQSLTSRPMGWTTGGSSTPLRVIDVIEGKIVNSEFDFHNMAGLQAAQQAILHRPTNSTSRLVIYENLASAGSQQSIPNAFCEPSRKVLDYIGSQYHVNPQILLPHFVHPSILDPKPSSRIRLGDRPLGKPPILRLHGSFGVLFSAQLCIDGGRQDSTTCELLSLSLPEFD